MRKFPFLEALLALLLFVTLGVTVDAQTAVFRFPAATGGRVAVVSSGTYILPSSPTAVTISNDVRLADNAKLIIPNGVTLTLLKSVTFDANSAIEVAGGTLNIQGEVSAAPTQHIFQATNAGVPAAGAVNFTGAKPRSEAYGEWFGARGGSAGTPNWAGNDYTNPIATSAAFTRAFAAFGNNPGTVKANSGYYYLDCFSDHAINIENGGGQGKSFIGSGRGETYFYISRNCPVGNYVIRNAQGAAFNSEAEGAHIGGFSIMGTLARVAGTNTLVGFRDHTSGGVLCVHCRMTKLHDIRTYLVRDPFTLNSFSYSQLHNTISTWHTGVIRLGGGSINDGTSGQRQMAFASELRDVISYPDGGYGQSLVIDSGTADVDIIRFSGGSRDGNAFVVTNTSVWGAPPELTRVNKVILDQTHEGALKFVWGRNFILTDSIVGTTIDGATVELGGTTNTNSPVVFETEARTIASATTNGSTTVTPSTDILRLSAGMSVSGTGIPAGAKVASVPMQVILSQPATATNASVALTFGGFGSLAVSTTNGSTTVNVVNAVPVLAGATVTGAGIPGGTTVASVILPTTVTLSAAATATAAAVSLTYTHPPEAIEAITFNGNTVRGGGGSGLRVVRGCNIVLNNNTFHSNGFNTGSFGGVQLDSICGLFNMQGGVSGITGAAGEPFANITGFTQDYGVVLGSGLDAAVYSNSWNAPGRVVAARTFRPRIHISGVMLQGNLTASILDNTSGWTARCGAGGNKCIENNMTSDVGASEADLSSVYGYGALGDGSTDDRAAIAAMNAARPVRFTKGVFRVASNITISGTATFEPGASIVPDTGVTVTFSGPVVGPLEAIFAGLGSVSLGREKVEIFPEWFGAVSGSVASGVGAANTTAFQKSHDACSAGCTIKASNGIYVLSGSTPVRFTKFGVNLQGSGLGSTIFGPETNGVTPLFAFSGGQSFARDFQINPRATGIAAPDGAVFAGGWTTDGIWTERGWGAPAVIENLYIANINRGIWARYGNDGLFRAMRIQNCVTACIQGGGIANTALSQVHFENIALIPGRQTTSISFLAETNFISNYMRNFEIAGGAYGIVLQSTAARSPEWTPSTAYTVGQEVGRRFAVDGTTVLNSVYRVTVAGTSGTTGPTITTNAGGTQTEGGVTWEWVTAYNTSTTRPGNNWFESSNVDFAQLAALWIRGATWVDFQKMTFTGTQAGPGVLIENQAGAHPVWVSGVSLVNNYIGGNAHQGVRWVSGADVYMASNRVYGNSVASGGTYSNVRVEDNARGMFEMHGNLCGRNSTSQPGGWGNLLSTASHCLVTTAGSFSNDQGIPAIARSTAYTAGNVRRLGTFLWIAMTSGTTAASGGPVNPDFDEVDGTVTWRFWGVAQVGAMHIQGNTMIGNETAAVSISSLATVGAGTRCLRANMGAADDC